MQVASGRFEYLLRVRYNVVPTEQEFFQLKPETFLQAQRAASRTHAADDFGSLSGNEKDQNFIPGGVNRVILGTDGDFNVGATSQGELVRLIEEKRKTGVFLSILGFGHGNLKDATMEQLAHHGNGHYAYIDNAEEAHRIFVEQGAALQVVAHIKDTASGGKMETSCVPITKLAPGVFVYKAKVGDFEFPLSEFGVAR